MERIIIMVISAEGKPQDIDDLVYAGEYLAIVGIPKIDYAKRLRVRRLICRVCRLKFRTRQETQDHIRREHRRGQARSYWK